MLSHSPLLCNQPIQLTNLPPFVWDSRCEAYFRYPGIVAAFQRLFIGCASTYFFPPSMTKNLCVLNIYLFCLLAVFMLRTYAIYGRSLVAAGIIALFLIAEFVTKLVSIAFRSLAAVAVWGRYLPLLIPALVPYPSYGR